MKAYINTVFDEVYSADAIKEVILPGEDGELSIMDFHQPIVCRLANGNIKVISPHKEEIFSIRDGIAHMKGNTLKIMAEV